MAAVTAASSAAVAFSNLSSGAQLLILGGVGYIGYAMYQNLRGVMLGPLALVNEASDMAVKALPGIVKGVSQAITHIPDAAKATEKFVGHEAREFGKSVMHTEKAVADFAVKEAKQVATVGKGVIENIEHSRVGQFVSKEVVEVKHAAEAVGAFGEKVIGHEVHTTVKAVEGLKDLGVGAVRGIEHAEHAVAAGVTHGVHAVGNFFTGLFHHNKKK